jgi:cytochrome c oxidase subunit 3
MSVEAVARPDADVEFQFHDARFQADTALSGMWLFLASEALFFGGLFLTWCVYRHQHPLGFADATRDTQFTIGTINTVVLVTSSFVYACAVAFARRGDNRRILLASLATMALGMLFLGLKVLEWYLDIHDGEVPGASFRFRGSHDGGAELFWIFYYIGTGLHGVHLTVGIALVGWIAWRARKQAFSPSYTTPVEVVGLYWSFVDMVWMVLYPLIYLAGRAGG